MIRWCCYCQRLQGEVAPLTSFDISHVICESCTSRLGAGEKLTAEYEAPLRFFRELNAAARSGDPVTCASFAKRAYAAGFGGAEILVGLVQPALHEIGRRWEVGEVTVADEHRFTRWCQSMLDVLERPPARTGSLDILIVQAPGNRHDLGARLAEHVLLDSGISAEAITPDLPVSEVQALLRDRDVAWLGISCALPGMVEDARAFASELVAGGYRGGFILSGQAVRRAPEAWLGLDLVVCPTIEDARVCVLEGGKAMRPPRALTPGR